MHAMWLDVKKYFMDGTEPRKIFSLNILLHKLIYETNFSFFMWGDDTVQAHTSKSVLVQLWSIFTNNSSNNMQCMIAN